MSSFLSITSPFPTASSFEQCLYEAPVLTGSALKDMERQHGGSLYHRNGFLLHVTITTRVDIDYAIMRIDGFLAAPNAVIFEGLAHIMRYLFHYHYILIIYPHKPLKKKFLALHWGKGTAEFIPPEYGTVLVSTTDADYARDIRELHSITSHIHLLNGLILAWKCKKQSISTLHSTGSEITSLASGVKKTNHLRDFMASTGYPIGSATPTLKNIQGEIRAIKASRIHDSTRHLATKISWLNEQYVSGIIKLMYTKMTLQLADLNTKPLCGKHLQAMIYFLVGVRYYPQDTTKHY
jgi:hypothetical protein